MTVLEQMLDGAGSVVILGHVRPDGDCLDPPWDSITICRSAVRIYGRLCTWRKVRPSSAI